MPHPGARAASRRALAGIHDPWPSTPICPKQLSNSDVHSAKCQVTVYAQTVQLCSQMQTEHKQTEQGKPR